MNELVDMSGRVDGKHIIYDYTAKELREQREAVKQEIKDSRKPLIEVPLTEAEEISRWNRRMNRERNEDLINGIDRS